MKILKSKKEAEKYFEEKQLSKEHLQELIKVGCIKINELLILLETEEECKECGKKAELEIMIDSEDPLETPISITDIETNSKINMRLGLCNYPINIYYCKKCFNARL